MSNRDRDTRGETLVQSVRFAISQALKHQVRTALPGIVQSYSPATGRAVVQPALDYLLTSGDSIARAVLVDVPVMQPSGGGFVAHFPLVVGDVVWLMFSERDLAAFKQSLRRGPPPSGDIMPLSGAVAYPGWGQSVTPPVAGGVSIQTLDGGTAIELRDGQVTIRASSIRLEYQGGSQVWP